jgi:hypothetical protein
VSALTGLGSAAKSAALRGQRHGIDVRGALEAVHGRALLAERGPNPKFPEVFSRPPRKPWLWKYDCSKRSALMPGKHLVGMKVFSATKKADRDRLGEVVTEFLHAVRDVEVTAKVLQSSDASFHCISIVLWLWRSEPAAAA